MVINQHPKKTGCSLAALLLVGPRLLNFAAWRSAVRSDVWWGRSSRVNGLFYATVISQIQNVLILVRSDISYRMSVMSCVTGINNYYHDYVLLLLL